MNTLIALLILFSFGLIISQMVWTIFLYEDRAPSAIGIFYLSVSLFLGICIAQDTIFIAKPIVNSVTHMLDPFWIVALLSWFVVFLVSNILTYFILKIIDHTDGKSLKKKLRQLRRVK